jgi:uncharacterized protein YraI
VNRKNIFLFIMVMTLCASCGGQNTATTMPVFITATLLPTPASQATQTSTLPAPMPESNSSPVEGTTTTQVNVRAAPSTASESVGMIGPFVKIQVIGMDASGSWYQIIYSNSKTGKGWVRAEYAQVNASTEIPLVETSASPGSAVSGLVKQKINVRNGPGTKFDLLGVLNPNDIVSITGRDSSSAWIQIEFANSPDGRGWVSAEFLQMNNVENVPVIGVTADSTATPTGTTSTPNAIAKSAMMDGDSMQAPLASAVLSPTGLRALHVTGDISSPNGDIEDWIQFSTDKDVVAIQVTCLGSSMLMKLWKDGNPLDDPLLSCGNKSFIQVTPNSIYFLRLLESNANEPGYTSYILNLEGIR